MIKSRLLSALDPNGDDHDPQRQRLQTALNIFRERVGNLIGFIPRDMPGYTVHDLTHLDALWEMADLFTGSNYSLNPAETFVLGGAILLHDAGMTVAAYPNGKEDIEKTLEYSNAYTTIKNQLSSNPKSAISDSDIRSAALIEALRNLHAQKAEELATTKWRSPQDASEIFLLDDSDLRTHYATTIGRIAHSHHWSHSKLQTEFASPIGAAPDFPASWTVDPLKISLILRCADATHIDSRRAPRLLFALTKPTGISAKHWSFQSLIAKPLIEHGKLIYTSTSDFDLDNAEAWQIAFDTLRMVDNELRSAEEINIQKGYPSFIASGVLGSNSPEHLAKYIKAYGWKPVTLNLRVSNVPHLARTLGGKDLYSFHFAPLRELIQNAADSIEARATIDHDFNLNDGKIQISILEEDSDETVIEISDNGVGMSERVLTGPLLDFGLSFWKSHEAQREFPSLQNSELHPRGRYGIGFFSIFMWASDVAVISRRYFDSVTDTKVLHFSSGLDARPILKNSNQLERSTLWSTRIRLRIPSSILNNAKASYTSRQRRYEIAEASTSSWKEAIKLICATLPIPVTIKLSSTCETVNLPNWKESSPAEFFNFFKSILGIKENSIHERFSSSLTDIIISNQTIGRAFLSLPSGYNGSSVLVYDKGIYAGRGEYPNTYGIMEGQVTNAARERFEHLRSSQLLDWAIKSSEKSFSICSHEGETLGIQKALSNYGVISESRPLFILNRKLVSLSGLIEIARNLEEIIIFLKQEDTDTFVIKPAESLSIIYGTIVDPRVLHCLMDLKGKMGRNQSIDTLLSEDSLLSKTILKISDAFGINPEITSTVVHQEGYRSDYIKITIRRVT